MTKAFAGSIIISLVSWYLSVPSEECSVYDTQHCTFTLMCNLQNNPDDSTLLLLLHLLLSHFVDGDHESHRG